MFPKLYTFPYVNEELGTLLVSQGSYKNEKKLREIKLKKRNSMSPAWPEWGWP